MKFFKSFIKKPRNVYFSIVAMLTIVAGLASISFSYYIDESSIEGILKYNAIDNRLQSPDLVDGNVALAPHETKEIELYVMSNNSFMSQYKVIYKTSQNVKVYSENMMADVIDAKEVQNYKFVISNYDDVPAQIELEVVSSEMNKDLNFEGNEVEVLE